MSRFKESNRIENAIKHKNKAELLWALSYAEMRLNSASMKHHEKHWRKIIKKIEQALEEIE